MIIVNKNSTEISIPIHHPRAHVKIDLVLVHNLTGERFKFYDSVNYSKDPNYVTITNMRFTYMPSCEYTYNLNDVETGLLRLLSDENEIINYNTEKRIIQYGD